MPPIRLHTQCDRPKDWKGASPRRPIGQARKIALLGGAKSIKFAPWHDPTWELWSHASCRNQCVREPDLLFDLHPPELWRDPEKKFWDTSYHRWLQQNHLPIMMQERYPDVPCSIRYPFETMITQFPRGYMTNSMAYMVALALMEGVTQLGVFGCNYDSQSEYGPQRGGAEYWLGIAEGRGVQVMIPPTCDLLGRPSLLYGYESHPNGRRDPSYSFHLGIMPPIITEEGKAVMTGKAPIELESADGPDAIPLMNLGVPPALERRNGNPYAKGLKEKQAWDAQSQ